MELMLMMLPPGFPRKTASFLPFALKLLNHQSAP